MRVDIWAGGEGGDGVNGGIDEGRMPFNSGAGTLGTVKVSGEKVDVPAAQCGRRGVQLVRHGGVIISPVAVKLFLVGSQFRCCAVRCTAE